MITSEILEKLFPLTPASKRNRFIKPLNKYMAEYGITSYLRVCAFIATGGIECDYLKTTTEYHSGANYEGRKDLGNRQKGDGVRFRGRGFFQTTGRYNYSRINKTVGAKLGINFLANPEKLAEIEIAVLSACIFWEENNLAKYADTGEFKQFSAVVNCGNPKATPNHWAKRNELYSKCKRVIPRDFSFENDLLSNKQNDSNQQLTAQINQPQSLLSNKIEAQTNLSTSTTQTVSSTPDASEPTKEDSFLTTAFDRNLSADAAKAAVPSIGKRFWRFLARPLMLLYALLEAGNIAAWFGVIVAFIAVGLLIYWHRKEIKKGYEILKRKFIE